MAPKIEQNQALLEAFVNTINGREGTGSHLVTIPPSHLADALLSSPIIQGEDGSGPTNFGSGGGFDFGVDPNEDPELALALRVSMEEQRQRQQEEERRVAQESGNTSGVTAPTATVTTTTAGDEGTASPSTAIIVTDSSTGSSSTVPVSGTTEIGAASEEEMLQQALAMSLETGGAVGASSIAKDSLAASSTSSSGKFPDFSTMTEEEQIAYAMQMSLQNLPSKEEPMEVDEKPSTDAGSKSQKMEDDKADVEPDFSEVISDPAFLQDVLESLPGVDPQSKVVRQAVGSITARDKEKKEKKEKKKEEDEKK